MAKTRKIMIVAGESSGDTHAAKLVRALRDAEPETDFQFFGAAGPKMRNAGVEEIVRSDDLSIVGLAEIFAALPVFLRTYRDLKRAAIDRQPDVVILVDFPDFNLRLARALKKERFRVVNYISPQLWAWRKHRVRAVKRDVDLVLSILPFEKDWYARNGFENVEYVGSPLAREVHSNVCKDDFCRKHSLDPAQPIIALLPGSRNKEIARILPIMLAASSAVCEQDRSIQFLIAVGSPSHTSDAKRAIDDATRRRPSLPEVLRVIEAETYDALNASDAAAVTSGTATLEAGIIGTPMVVVYKTSTLNYNLLEPMIDVPHYGLVNLIAGKRVATELIQSDLTAQSLSDELLRLLEPGVNSAMRAELKTAADRLGHGGASKRAAEAILDLIDRDLS
jgi:lipid-A-disaccharide synthase